jgi:poly-beta-hydroxybutyrate-responsive repressor
MHGSEMHGILPPFLLLLIHECPGHGYDLIDRLPCLGVTGVEPGQAYRVLRRLERERLVLSTWVTSAAGPARRRYEVTAKGEAQLDAWMIQLAQFGEVLAGCLGRWHKSCGSSDGREGRTRLP